ncbi:MAG: hypothetical protein ACAH95_03015 [Fimbriimonas sp.]
MKREFVFVSTVLCLGGLWGCGSKEDAPATDAQPKPPAARLAVKTATDADAATIDLRPKTTTVEEIAATKGGETVAGRTGPFETSTWEVEATIRSVQLKKDGDYYMVVQGDKGGQAVVEVPDPAKCKGSPLEPQIAATRRELEQKYHPTSEVKNVNDRATIDGVGFLGWGKNSKGAKGKSGARLMPGTGVKFRNG